MSDGQRTGPAGQAALMVFLAERRTPSPMTIDVQGRVALVTGGSRGIGAEIVRSLHAIGFRVFFTYVAAAATADELVAELGHETVACVACDVADPVAVATLVPACLARFGRLDVLVNNAGMFAENPFDGDDLDAWRAGWARTFAVNVFGLADVTWHALRSMRANAGDARGTRGRIINITSRASHRGETTFADYGASKAAVGNFTKSIARGCARDGIVAFSVAPGFIVTEMAADAIAQHGNAIRAEIPAGRIGTPDDVARIVAFLAAGDADYATGTTIDVNGASYVR